jgi:hypothetical protein
VRKRILRWDATVDIQGIGALALRVILAEAGDQPPLTSFVSIATESGANEGDLDMSEGYSAGQVEM